MVFSLIAVGQSKSIAADPAPIQAVQIGYFSASTVQIIGHLYRFNAWLTESVMATRISEQ
jgi:hypothetical protein